MRILYNSRAYRHLPVSVQSLLVTLKGAAYATFRRGARYRQFSDQLLHNEHLDEKQIAALQLTMLKRILTAAYSTVPYYKSLLERYALNPSLISCASELERLPFMTKPLVREYYSQLLATNVHRRFVIKGSTSGSTGTPLSLYMPRSLIQAEYAFIRRQYRWAGLSPKGRVASFRGDLVVPTLQRTAPYWRYDGVGRELWFSSYHISGVTALAYLQRLERFDPELIYCYPSSLALLAGYARERGYRLSLPALKGIVTSSETLTDEQKTLMQEIFGCSVFDWYGHFERTVFIGTCEKGSYHIFPDYGFVEFIPVQRTGQDVCYELVGTGFHNAAMPLIRYRTGDLVTLINTPCECGRAFPRIKSIVGRGDDAIVTPAGRVVGRLDHVFKEVQHILLAQIVQESVDEVAVFVVPGLEYSKSDAALIAANMHRYLGNDVSVRVVPVNDIPRLPSGKFKAVISHVSHIKGSVDVNPV